MKRSGVFSRTQQRRAARHVRSGQKNTFRSVEKNVATAACYALRGLRNPPPESDRQRSHRRARRVPRCERHRPTLSAGRSRLPARRGTLPPSPRPPQSTGFPSVIRRTRVRSDFLLLTASPSPERASPRSKNPLPAAHARSAPGSGVLRLCLHLPRRRILTWALRIYCQGLLNPSGRR